MKFCISLLFTLFIPSLSLAMSLETYINSLKNNDLEVRRFVHQQVQTRFNADLQLPNSAWVLTLANTHGLATMANGTTTRRTTGNIRKNFRSTGTNIEFGYNKNSLADRAEEVRSLQLEQSLLRNFFGMQTRELEASYEEANRVTLWQIVESYEDYLAQKTVEYLEFVLAYENYRTATELLSDMQTLKKEIDQRQRNNIALDVDVYRTKLQLLQYQRNRLEAKTQMERLRRSLFAAFADDKKNLGASVPPRVIPYHDGRIDFAADRENFLANSRTINIQKSQVQAADLNLRAQKKDYYPEANLVLGYNNDQSRRFSTPVSREEAVVGFNLNFSLDSSLTTAQVDQAHFQKTQAELQGFSAKQQVENQLNILEQEIILFRERVEILEQQVGIAKKLVAGEKARYRRGRVDLETIINAQTSYQQVRYEHTQQKVELAKRVVAWNQVTDRLVVQLPVP